MIYQENKSDIKTKLCRDEYLKGIFNIIAKKEAKALNIRKENFSSIFEHPEEMRKKFKEMLGWPLKDNIEFDCKVESKLLQKCDRYDVYRLRFEILEGLKLTGLFFKISSEEPKPLVIAQHGGGGTPEMISGFYDTTYNYNDLTERILQYNVHVFAPQLLIWNPEDHGPEFDRRNIDGQLKRIGSSITALEIFGLQKVLDYFENKKCVKNFGMIGLSYGGFYTMFLSACDIRIKSAITCSQFNDRKKYAWSDWTWNKSAFTFSDAEIACLIYPRHLCIEVGRNDDLFDCESAVKEHERIVQMCNTAGIGTDWLDFISFDGNHEFCKDDKPIKHLVESLEVEK